MKPARTVSIAFVVLASLILAGPLALWGQMAPAPTAPVPPSPSATTPAAPAAASSGSGVLTAVVLIIGLLILVGIAVKLFDLKRKRETEAVHLQAQISDALLREQALFGLPITPTAHVGIFRRSPARVVITGQVPTAELREAVIRLARQEATRLRPDVEVEDRIAVVPSMVRVA